MTAALAYYNDTDPFCAAWLQELCHQGVLPDGPIDTRSIADVTPDTLLAHQHCHFFAGIGGWAYALQLAGWPADRPVWTGSCPCQPFSAAGQRKGNADERHLWPAWFRLIQEWHPPTIVGEQVASAIGHGWLDLVFRDLEGEGYACGAVVLGAHSVGAPQLRQRVYFVADAEYGRREGMDVHLRSGELGEGAVEQRGSGGVAVAQHAKRGPQYLHSEDGRDRENAGREEAHRVAGTRREIRGVAKSSRERRQQDGRGPSPHEGSYGGQQDGDHISTGNGADCGVGVPLQDGLQRRAVPLLQPERWRDKGAAAGQPSPSPWADLDWLPCRDGKYRPTQPGLFPLAHGVPARVGRLRGYGNAIVPQVAAAFIRAFLDTLNTADAGVTP